MLVLTNPVRDYAWGSTRRLAAFLGREPSGAPEAELWIGAHAGDPSVLPDGRRLDEAIAADPAAMLGEGVAARHGRLPFLMKVLSVAEPLSLQVHPTPERARAGFEREERAGIPLDAAGRSYRDPWHKPELVYALTRFEGMAGFRDVERSAALLRLLGHRWADDLAERLGSGEPAHVLREAVAEILALGPAQVGPLLAELVERAQEAAARGHEQERRTHVPRGRTSPAETGPRREPLRVLELLPDLAAHYPQDPGVLVALLLNHVVLAAGEAMYVGAGVVHAYASGFGLEIMAASDNVLRAGLTPKHRDVPELMAATDFTPTPSPRWSPIPRRGADATRFEPPVEDFVLTVGAAEEMVLDPTGPALLLALDERSTVREPGGVPRPLARGESVFLRPGEAAPGALGGSGTVAVGSVPS